MRLLIFADTNSPIPANAVLATLRAAAIDPELEVCGLVTTQPSRFEHWPARVRARRAVKDTLVAWANRERRASPHVPRRVDGRTLSDRGVPVIVPNGGDVNSPEFLQRLRLELRPDVALSYFFSTIFKRPLLEQLPQAVNLHPALLPKHRGLRPTAFALYDEDEYTGLTFHRMSEGIDAGPILLQTRVRIDAEESHRALGARLAIAAASAVPEMLDLVRSNAPGRPQEGLASYHSAADAQHIVNVTRSDSITHDELRRRIQAFGTVEITIDGAVVPVTRLRRAREGAPLAFRTADGVVVAPDRISQVPLSYVRLKRATTRLSRPRTLLR